MNQMQTHSQIDYQSSLMGQQQNQSLSTNNSVFTSLGYNPNQQAGQSLPNVLYNLNFNQLDQEIKECPGILYDSDNTYSIHTNPIKLENLDELNDQAENNQSLESTVSTPKPKHKDLGHKRQKKMKFTNDLDSQSDISNSAYLSYQNAQLNSNYYHKQVVGSSSITSSNSSSTSSSPLSSSSPSHQQQLNQVNSNMSLSNQSTNQLPSNPHQKIMSGINNSQFSYTTNNQPNLYAYNHSDMRTMEEINAMKVYSDEDIMEGCKKSENSYEMMDTNVDDFQRVKLKKSKKDPIVEYDSELAESIEFELGLKKQNGPRKNSWGNLSYAELITRAIESSSDQRLTLSQIYDWIVKYVPYFKEKFDRTSSAGWKNSIRHNLSLHNRFIRVQNESSGKSSWWMINPDMSKYNLNTPMCASNLMGSNGNLNGTTNPFFDAHIINNTSDDLIDANQGAALDANPLIKSENQDAYNSLNLSIIRKDSDSGDNKSGSNHVEGSACSKPSSSLADFNQEPGTLSPITKSSYNEPSKTNRSIKAKNKSTSRQSKQQAQTSKLKSKMSKTDLEAVKLEKINNEVNSGVTNGTSYSPSSPGSTSSLKENDSLNNNPVSNNNATISENSKLSQNLIYYNLSSSGNPSGIQSNLLTDSPSSLSSSSSSNIPYQNCTNLSADSSNSILRAALQKSTINGGSPHSSNSNPPTPTATLVNSASTSLAVNPTLNISPNNSHLPFSDLNSQMYNTNRHIYNSPSYNGNQGFSFNPSDNLLFSNSYSNSRNSYEVIKQQQSFNQNFFGANQTSQSYASGMAPNTDGYFLQSNALSGSGSSLLTPTTTVPSSLPASSPSSSSTSSSTSSSNMPNSYSNQNIYSNYYTQSVSSNNLSGSSQIYPNSIYKSNHSQYPSSIYDSNSLAIATSTSNYYDLNRSMPPQLNVDSTLESNTNNDKMSHQRYDEMNNYQELLNTNSSMNSSQSNIGNISTGLKPVGCYYN